MGTVEVEGRRLECVWSGAAARTAGSTARALVFLHHGLGSAGTWRDFPARLADRLGLPAFAYSRLGHGRSDPPACPRGLDYVHREARAVLPAVLAAAGIAEPVLFGHSDGATMALLYAGMEQARAPALVAEAPHVFVEERTLEGIRAAHALHRQGALTAGLARRHGANADPLFRAWADTWLDPAFRAWSCEDALGAVRCPVLLIQGADDEYATPLQLERIRAGVAGPAAIRLLEGVRHEPHKERPEAVLAEAAAFLAAALATFDRRH